MKGVVGTGTFRVDVDKKQANVGHLDSLLRALTISTWADLRDSMLNTTIEVFGKPKTNHKHAKGLPCKKWFDDTCKMARKQLKGITRDAYQQAAKKYHALIRKNKREY